MYAFAAWAAVVPEGTNPARGIEKFKESCRERFLTAVELERLGSAIREAETTASHGQLIAPSSKPSICRRVRSGSRKSIRSRRRRSGY
jgi:hypothetical protein